MLAVGAFALTFLTEDGLEVLGAIVWVFRVDGVLEEAGEME